MPAQLFKVGQSLLRDAACACLLPALYLLRSPLLVEFVQALLEPWRE